MTESILIIGAGIGGLSAGCYAQMNGYRTQLYEMHDKPGGVCTSWRRKGYVFDGCIHHLAGSGPRSQLCRVWNELGALHGKQVIYYDELARLEAPDGKAFTVYTDLDRLEQHLFDLAPADARISADYVAAARRFTRFDMFAAMLGEPALYLRMLPLLPSLVKWGKVTLEQYAQRFTDPFLRSVFPWIQYDFAGIPAVVNLMFLAGCHNQTMGWPEGGSLGLAEAIAQRYTSLGGQIHFKSRVQTVLVENDRAVGVRLTDGSEHRADIVISNADGYSTIFNMLDGRYASDRIRGYYAAAPDHQDMTLHVNLGVARDLSHEAHAITLLLEQPVVIAGRARERLDLELFSARTGMAREGTTAIKTPLDSGYAYWKALADQSHAAYDDEKHRVAEAVIAQVAKRFPGIAQQIEVVDVSTPLTVERYTASYQGLQAWSIPGASPFTAFSGLSKTLPGLGGFYMVGQWAAATIGLSTAAIMARKLIRELCQQAGKRFHTLSA